MKNIWNDPRSLFNGNHFSSIYVIGYGKTAHFAHYFKIELLVFKGSVDLTLWTPRVYCKSPPTKPNCLRVRQPQSQIVFTSV